MKKFNPVVFSRAVFYDPDGNRSETDEELRLRLRWIDAGCLHCANAPMTGRRCDAHRVETTESRLSVVCVHGSASAQCFYCMSLRERLGSGPLSTERASIVDYLEWAASIEVGTILSPEERQGVRYAAAWVKNRLDLKPRE